MEKLSALQFERFRDYLKYRIELETEARPGRRKISLRRYAKSLGYSSPSLLSMMLRGVRAPSDEALLTLFTRWDLSPKEREYLRTIAHLEKAQKKGKDTTQLLKRMGRIGSIPTYHKIDLQKFNAIREWYYLVIKLLVGSPDFQEDPAWIAKRLRRKVGHAKIQEALDTMLSLGILERDSSGKLRPSFGYAETTHNVPSHAIREHHKGMIARALEAVEEQEIGNRNLNSLTLRFDANRMEAAKEKMLQFVKEFNQEFESPESTRVFQLNLQLFEHTSGPSFFPPKENN